MNRYIEHIIKDLVRDTKIDYNKREIHFPFYPSLPSFKLTFHRAPLLFLNPHPPITSSFFSKYCKNRYGLTEEEIEYVWDQYKTIILDKINE